MRVKIISAKRAAYWYADKIGEVFDVEIMALNHTDYLVSDTKDTHPHWILKTDCEEESCA